MKKNKIVLVLACVFSFLFLGYILKSSNELSNVEAKLIESPNVIDATKLIKTRSLITDKQLIGNDWTQRTFEDNSWNEIGIPAHENVGNPAFKVGNYIYYRIIVPSSALTNLTQYQNEISLSLQEIQLKKFDVFLNGNHFRTYTPKTIQESMDVLPLKDGQDNIISVMGKIEPGDYGIYSRAKILIGKTGEINQLYLASYKSGPVFNLMYLLCKGSILIVFTLLFLVVSIDSFFEKSLLFIIFVISEDIIVGEYLSQYVSLYQQVGLYNLVNIGINICLFLFLDEVLERGIPRKWILIGSVCLTLISTVFTFDLLKFNYFFNFDLYLKFWNYTFVLVLLYFLPLMLKREKVLASIVCIALGFTLWSSLLSENIGFNLKTFANLLIFFGVAYQTFMQFRREQIQLMEQEKDVAIGRTAAVLAHDVRRPLDQMSLILEKISSGDSSEEFLRIAKQDVEFSITSVDNHINDIMNFTRVQKVELRPVSFYNVLSKSIKQVMSTKTDLELKLTYDFKVAYKPLSEESRLANVLVNLIANAVEAIQYIGKSIQGHIHFESIQRGQHFEFRITNSGPHIPNEIINEIFKPLFTSGKDGGTGLGLASVAKIVKDHNGEISVRNVDQGGVQFILALKMTNDIDNIQDYTFEAHSNGYSYRKAFVEEIKAIESLRILLLDTNSMNYEHLNELIKSLSFNVELFHATSVSQAEAMIKSKRYDVYLSDHDLGGESGVDFYKRCLSFLKDEVFILNNQYVPSSIPMNIEKPLTLDSLKAICTKANQVRKKILLVEDSKIITLGWIMFHGKHNVYSVSNPIDALKFLETKPDVDICVLDYHFDGFEMNGVELASSISKSHPKLEVIIASSVEIKSSLYKQLSKGKYEIRW